MHACNGEGSALILHSFATIMKINRSIMESTQIIIIPY